MYMYLVNWVESVTLSGDAKVVTLVTPFVEGEIVVLSTYHDTYMFYTELHY